ncbi:30S ribosomal protein S4e [archaeon]|nr:30S ribosomal protein S4e [archaeon]
MANKGESKSQKSISAPRARYFLRKANVFTVTNRPGAHNKESSVPLIFALKELLKVSNNAREGRNIIKEGKVKVNGTIRRQVRLPVGLFDIIALEALKKKWRLTFDTKRRIVAHEIDAKGKDFKISKITGKRKVKGGKILLTTNDGFTIDLGKEKVNVDDSVKLSLPEMKIEEVFALEKGNSVFIIGGSHVGETSKVDSISEGTLQRKKLISLYDKERKFQTISRNIFVVGKGKSEIEVLEG